MNFGTKILENAVTNLGTIVKKPRSITSEKTKQLWSRVFLSHRVCTKRHLAAANAATEERSCLLCWQEPSSWQALALTHPTAAPVNCPLPRPVT